MVDISGICYGGNCYSGALVLDDATGGGLRCRRFALVDGADTGTAGIAGTAIPTQHATAAHVQITIQKDSAQLQEAFMNGEPVEIHQMMIKAQEAGISMDLLLEVRNKLVNAYSEIMRMPI